ncbi:MAG: HGGxSTG domain-containing protein [Kiloniellales bacterium]|nr:HGGxSTG domain-containing protein [Kiloniellales bacterium]
MHQSPRCGVRTRKKRPCRSPAMSNGRCRMHGGKSPGAPKGNRNAWKHGYWSAAAIEERRAMSTLFRVAREQLDSLREEI